MPRLEYWESLPLSGEGLGPASVSVDASEDVQSPRCLVGIGRLAVAVVLQ